MLDLDARIYYFQGTCQLSPAIWVKIVGAGSQYAVASHDADGRYLDPAPEPPLPEGRDAFHCVPDFSGTDGDAVERVPTGFRGAKRAKMSGGSLPGGEREGKEALRAPLALRIVGLSLVPAFHVLAAEPAGVTNAAAQAMIQAFLRQEAVRLDAQFLDGITNRQQWEARRPELRQQYLEMLGLWPLPERTPLNAQVTGTIEREEGFRVEKLHFQSRPHLYVTGNLYLPKDAKPGAKLPAVLYVCGHSGRGRDGNKTAFQHHGMWFATHGYVCLIIDSLQLGEIAAIHHGTYRYDRWWWQARGYTPAAVECWNGIRALDYLQSRPEVDPDRLAVTGISGGGAATFWIAAADERVKVAVPVSGMGDLEDYVGEKVVNGHCDCMFLINTFQWPWTHIAALVAPRPLLFENSGHDPIFPMNGNDRIRARLERLYGFYTNRTERLFDIGVTPGGHNDNPELRLMAYRWINWHLKGSNAPVTEPELPSLRRQTTARVSRRTARRRTQHEDR